MSNNFYIGYQDKVPEPLSKFIQWVMVLLILLLIAGAWLLASKQKGFISSTYEYYQETEITGIMIKSPMPSIQVFWGTTADDKPLVQTIPVVQFGKIGGMSLAEKYEGALVTARGFLIYYDSKALLEIADPDNLQLANEGSSTKQSPIPVQYGNEASFIGEILDAKCFFGVMKPGHGKPHRSCAIRCISGGIPAVLSTQDQQGNNSYRIIHVTTEFEHDVTSYVGEKVLVKGVTGTFNDWKVLKLDAGSSIEPVGTAEQ
jgi:hypothetical protein